MKNTFYILFFLFGFFQMTNAQIVSIPDANFKAKLLTIADTNSDGEIQVSEALAVTFLNLNNSSGPNYSISDITGIEAFVNLISLQCYNNNLTELDLSSNINLTNLNCYNNNLTLLDVSNSINLTNLNCYDNNLTLLDVSNNINLTNLNCSQNDLIELNIANNINLTNLNCYNNNLTELDVSNNINLTDLNCSYNDLIELDIANNINLTFFTCGMNSLTELDISNNVNLTDLSCTSNSLTELDVSNNVNLASLGCGFNNLTELDVSNNVNLTALNCNNNNLTELGVSNNVNLTYLRCTNNYLTELDLSNNSDLIELWANHNWQLAYINLKNGGNLDPNANYWETQMWLNYPSNMYICADEEEAMAILPQLNKGSATGQLIATYCYIPGANYNIITGSVFFTDSGSCDEDDITYLTKVTIDDGTDGGASFTNQNGEYNFFTQEGEFVIAPEVENPSFFNITPVTETVTFADSDNNVEVVNFCLTPNGIHNDLEVVITPIVPARPGFNATYKIVYRNKGNQVISQTNGISLAYDDNYMDFVFATQTPSSQSTSLLMWDYENLKPFESRSILITLKVNTPTNPIFPVNIDDVLPFSAVIFPLGGDENITDNFYIFNQTVVGAYDPNDITCIEGDVVHPDNIGEELHYVIRFENTGNFYAENVVVAMEIDTTKYDVDSVRLLNTSHNAVAQIKNDVLEVFFNQIMLDSGGHGNILLVMKSVSSLSEGDSVQSKADIYFDYNYPIITNDAVTLFQATMSIEDNPKAIDLRFYPNPTTDYFNITSQEIIQSVELYDTSGRLIRTSLVNDFESKQNVSNLTNGIYILKIKTNKGEVTGKIVKQ